MSLSTEELKATDLLLGATSDKDLLSGLNPGDVGTRFRNACLSKDGRKSCASCGAADIVEAVVNRFLQKLGYKLSSVDACFIVAGHRRLAEFIADQYVPGCEGELH